MEYRILGQDEIVPKGAEFQIEGEWSPLTNGYGKKVDDPSWFSHIFRVPIEKPHGYLYSERFDLSGEPVILHEIVGELRAPFSKPEQKEFENPEPGTTEETIKKPLPPVEAAIIRGAMPSVMYASIERFQGKLPDARRQAKAWPEKRNV
jgi:hypothetical protein